MDEIKMVEDYAIEVVDNVVEDIIPSTNSNMGTVGMVAVGVGVVAAAAVGITAWFRKNRGKLTERQIAKLEKKGYIVTKSAPMEGQIESTLVDETK